MRQVITTGNGEKLTQTRSGTWVYVAAGTVEVLGRCESLGEVRRIESHAFTRTELRDSICHGSQLRERDEPGWQIPKHIAGAIRRTAEAWRLQRLEALDAQRVTRQ